MAHEVSRTIAGTVSVVTGASAGIGAATARTLVQAEGRVALAARRGDRLDALVQELGADNALALVGDVRDPEFNTSLIAAAVDRWGRVDTIVPNAGVGAYGGILDIDDEMVKETVDTNFLATVWCVRAGVRAFRRQGDGGDIVIIASAAGFRGWSNEAVYAGTKHAQVGLAGSLDRELRAEGVRVTLICPAGVATEFAIGAGREAGSAVLDEYLRPDDVAHAVRVVLEQSRSVRTTVWQLWSMRQDS